jgi:Xaa-Pro aminopeptidase
MFDLGKIQEFLKKEKLEGWLMADFHARNTVAVEFLNLPLHLTRRMFYFIPVEGEPIRLAPHLEKEKSAHLPGKTILFASYKILEATLAEILKGKKRIAMEYSPGGRLPYIGLVDAGTIELIRSFGVEIVSSADMVAYFQARLSPEQMETHRKAAKLLVKIVNEAFELIKKHISGGVLIDERMTVEFIKKRFAEENLVFDFEPNCSVDKNISNPHYEPPMNNSAPIIRGSLVLLDIWAKLNIPRAVFADITWMGYAGETVPEKYSSVFSIVTAARDRAVDCIRQKFPAEPVFGYDVDDACREVIEKAGYGEYYFHRTGHSILEAVHGPGPSIDNLETEDRRRLLPGHLFSIEPGIYLPDYGFRSEIDVLMTEAGPEVTTLPLQKEIIPILGQICISTPE